VKVTPGGVTISILGKELMVACPDGEREALLAAARELDERMRDIQDGGKVLGGERVAVMTALNLANELLGLRRQNNGVPAELDSRLQALTGRIEAALHEQ
jgi:cell division protein ZapA